MAPPFFRDVSDTAFMVAAFRAIETNRRDALFRDPLAARLAGEHCRAIAAMPGSFKFGRWVVSVRTVIIDKLILSSLTKGVDTVLNLGAGLDTRPYRMALSPYLRWIEVDYPRIIDLKEATLSGEAPVCRLERVKLDLVDQLARQKFLAEVSEAADKILLLTEGVIPYLSVEEVANLAEDLRQTEKIRFWVVDYYSPEALTYRNARHRRNAPFRFDPKDWFAFFNEQGWGARETRYIADEAARLKRPAPCPPLAKLWMSINSAIMPASRQRSFRTFPAYVLLERRDEGNGNGSHLEPRG
jgi:methyltransferase (TIGR00027 family)